jgi:hypothetical protein
MFYIVFGDFFHRIPFIFVITVQNIIPIFAYFWVLETFGMSKQTQSFWNLFSRKHTKWAQEVDMGPHEGATEVHHGGPTPGHVVGPISRLMSHFASFPDASWPKADYIYDPFGEIARRLQKKRNTKNRCVKAASIGAETLPKSLMTAPSAPLTTYHSSLRWRGSSLSWTMRLWK